MKERIEYNPYDWIILLLLGTSAIIRFIMNKFDFIYTDYFIAIVNLIGLDYTISSILYSIKNNTFLKIDSEDFVRAEKANKKNRHKNNISICIIILIVYNILHMFLFSSSTGNDILSMIVLAISLTNNSIIVFIMERIKI